MTDHAPEATARLVADYDRNWHADGSARSGSPKWAKYRASMMSEFPLPFRGGKDRLAVEIGKFVKMINPLPPDADGSALLGEGGPL